MQAQEAVEGVLERSGCPIHYWLSGPEEAPPAIFLYNAMTDHRMSDTQVPAAGHNANQDNPESFDRVLLAFLEEHVYTEESGRTNTGGV